jgi:hypothetical protein
MSLLVARTALGLLLVGCVCSCQPIPRPFQPLEKTVSLSDTVIDRNYSLLLGGVQGASAEFENHLLARLEADLEELGVLSSRTASNRRSMTLWGNLAEQQDHEIQISWQIRDPVGEIAAIFEQRYFVKDGLLEELSQDAAFRVQSLLENNSEIWLGRSRRFVVFLPAVDGASGDGKFALTDAMRASLTYLDISVVTELQDNVMSVLGSVATTKLNETELIEIRWSLIADDGEELASVTQSSSVPRGSLDGRWGDVAKAIAKSGAQDIALLIRGYRQGTGIDP